MKSRHNIIKKLIHRFNNIIDIDINESCRRCVKIPASIHQSSKHVINHSPYSRANSALPLALPAPVLY
jgi:hypothetical protein